MSYSAKSFQDKENKSKSKYSQLKKVKDAHPEANFAHSPKAFHKLLNIQIASFIISQKKGRVIDLTKTNFAQLVLRNRSSIDFIKFSRRIMDQDQYHAYMSNDELSKEALETYNEESDEIESLQDFDEDTFQEKLKDAASSPKKPIDEIVFDEND